VKRYRPYSPEQPYLLPPSPREWLLSGHLAPFVLDLIRELDLSAIELGIDPGSDKRVFLSDRNVPLSRFGVDYIIKKHALALLVMQGRRGRTRASGRRGAARRGRRGRARASGRRGAARRGRRGRTRAARQAIALAPLATEVPHDSFLKRCFGWDRCTWRSYGSFRAYTWGSVIAANLVMLARHAQPDLRLEY
jgi:hypothetical protein